MTNPSDETVLTILTILELLGKRETPENVTNVYRMWQGVLKQRPVQIERGQAGKKAPRLPSDSRAENPLYADSEIIRGAFVRTQTWKRRVAVAD